MYLQFTRPDAASCPSITGQIVELGICVWKFCLHVSFHHSPDLIHDE
jgi:hypothetical protein